MAIEIFKRYENKYLLDTATLERMRNRFSDYMELDYYNQQGTTYTISNLYYDTDDNHLIRTSLSKPEYKEKLRLRAYDVPNGNEKVYIEIKKKVAKLTNKRRSAMFLDEAYEFLHTGIIPEPKPYMNRQVLNETAYILQQHKLCIWRMTDMRITGLASTI